MKLAIASLLLAASMAAAQTAVLQRSQFAISFSTDGAAWTSSLQYDPSSGPVFARLTIDYFANGGFKADGLNGARAQPMAAGWQAAAGDRILPFERSNRIVADYSETDGDGFQFGRVYGTTVSDTMAVHEYQFEGTDFVRIAAPTTTLHPGQGTGRNNFNGSGGMNLSGSPVEPVAGTTGLELFVWGMTFAPSRRGELVFDVPPEAFRLSPPASSLPNTRSTTWYRGSFSPPIPSLSFAEAPMLETRVGTLTFIPTPSALLTLGAAIAMNRRRR